MKRKLDKLGRICLPKEMCRALGIEGGDEVQIKEVPGGINLSPSNSVCPYCGSIIDLIVKDNGSTICRSCLDEFNGKVVE